MDHVSFKLGSVSISPRCKPALFLPHINLRRIAGMDLDTMRIRTTGSLATPRRRSLARPSFATRDRQSGFRTVPQPSNALYLTALAEARYMKGHGKKKGKSLLYPLPSFQSTRPVESQSTAHRDDWENPPVLFGQPYYHP